MIVSTRAKSIAAAACASALVFSGAGAATAQSVDGLGSSAPVFDSESEGALKSLGEGEYEVTYTNRSGKDLACAGLVLPEDLAKAMYESTQDADYTGPIPDPGDLDDEDAGDGDGEEAPSIDPELQEALDEAAENGHYAFVTGENGVSLREIVREVVLSMAEDNGEFLTEEELQEQTEQMLEGFEATMQGPGISAPVDEALFNFVDDGDTEIWSATMEEALAAGERAGGVMFCFDGLGRDATIMDSTYLEIENILESGGTGGDGDGNNGGGNGNNGGGQGGLSSEIFGSIERVFGS